MSSPLAIKAALLIHPLGANPATRAATIEIIARECLLDETRDVLQSVVAWFDEYGQDAEAADKARNLLAKLEGSA